MEEKLIPTLPGFEQTAAVVRVVRLQEDPAPLQTVEHYQDATMDGVERPFNVIEVDTDTNISSAYTLDSYVFPFLLVAFFSYAFQNPLLATPSPPTHTSLPPHPAPNHAKKQVTN